MRPPFRRPRHLAAATGLALTAAALTGCSVAAGASDGAEVVTIGYQSKTINTVTAGTLLRAQGYFEKRLAELGKAGGTRYEVKWLDYDTGAPITAQMLAGKIDIGSMGDYPLLINGSKAGVTPDRGTALVSVTGYNAKGALNGVVVAPDSKVRTLKDLDGKKISASVGSAGHGTLVQALKRAGIDPQHDVTVENQQPSVGASALQAGSVDAVSQFVAWPGVLAFRDKDRLIYDGGRLDVPTFHGVVVRRAYTAKHPDVVKAFLAAQLDATTYLHQHPLAAAETVAKNAGLPPEVVYLYNGRNGVSTFDPTLKPAQVEALRQDVPFLTSIGVLTTPVDVDAFVDDSVLRGVYPGDYAKDAASSANPAAITGTDTVCSREVSDPATAGELWVAGETDTRPAADPTCLLRAVHRLQGEGKTLRAAYVPDALTGTRWLADHSVWLRSGSTFLPFATQDNADTYRAKHPGASPVSYADAVREAK